MADLIKIKGGTGNVPTLQDREVAYRKDDKTLYIGTANGNVVLCRADDITELASLATTVSEQASRITELETALDEITARVEALETT